MNIYEDILNRYQKQPVRLDCKRNDIAHLFKHLGFKVGAEIGVDRGYYSKTLCQANPGVKLYCIDPWEVYEQYVDIRSQAQIESNYLHTQRLLKPYDCTIIKKTSREAVKDFAPSSLDFVYIDGNHKFEYVKEDLDLWSKVVRKGGIVSGHDYKPQRRGRTSAGKMPIVGVGQAVDLYVEENNIKTLFLTVRKGDSSWFFVKE